MIHDLGPRTRRIFDLLRDRILSGDLPPGSQLGELVRDYQDAVERRLADPLRTPLAAGERLYKLLMEPLRQWIPA